ncbi:MAG: prepilin-type N-terminal cleavage/methylation domain-containing protein [Candidatus Eremiobacteraeota bacterium]|nr:prepilin-type N-terminal cleavage/methylation domain-containing protein [Candidatus Eremiobacteraeota bacterium]
MLNPKSNNKKIGSRGFTLIELIIAMALGMIVTTAAYSLYVGVLHVSSRLQGEKDVINRLRVITEFMDHDLGQTDLKKTTIINAEKPGYKKKQVYLVAMAMPRAYDKDDEKFQTVKDTGLPIWKSLRVYYKLPKSDKLRMKEVYPEDPSELKLPISEKELKSYCDGKDDQLVAGKVTYFNPQPIYLKGKELSEEPKDRLGRMDIYMTLFYTNKKGINTHYEAKPSFVARNSFYEKAGPPHFPIPTPTPPADAPITPSDWKGASTESEKVE